MARFTVKGKNIPLNVKNTGMETSSLNIKTSDNWALFKHTERPLLLAGPCSAESEEQVLATASRLQKIGINVFRAGLWKPRTRPNCFEGVGEKGLKWLVKVQRLQGMKVGTEVANSHHVEECLKAGIDFLWIGARTMVLKGAQIPSNSIVGACALVNKEFTEENTVLAGIPAKIIKRNVNWDRRGPHEFK